MWNPSVGPCLAACRARTDRSASCSGSDTGKAVLRAGYAISTVRNGSNTFQSLLGSNQGLNYDTSINPSSYPTDFGAPGQRSVPQLDPAGALGCSQLAAVSALADTDQRAQRVRPESEDGLRAELEYRLPA